MTKVRKNNTVSPFYFTHARVSPSLSNRTKGGADECAFQASGTTWIWPAWAPRSTWTASSWAVRLAARKRGVFLARRARYIYLSLSREMNSRPRDETALLREDARRDHSYDSFASETVCAAKKTWGDSGAERSDERASTTRAPALRRLSLSRDEVLFCAGARDRLDLRSQVRHESPDANSKQTIRSVGGGDAVVTFKGLISNSAPKLHTHCGSLGPQATFRVFTRRQRSKA